MALLKRYTSSDAGGPGPLTGVIDSLNGILRACLVTGYGAFLPAGWTEPIAAAGGMAAFKQGAGSMFTVLVNDNAPNVTALAKEAWATGWEVLTGIAAPVGTGTGQFPTAAQLLTTGHGVVRKSATADGVGRAWIMYADNRTFYFLALSEGTANYTGLIFGDIYSVSTVADPYACMISFKGSENTAFAYNGFARNHATPTTTPIGWFYLARAWGGTGGSLSAITQGDYGRGSGSAGFEGLVQYPNGPDNAMYLSPIWVFEPTAGTVRGRMRGLYHVCHSKASFTDGQTFVGAGDYAGKSFAIIKNVMDHSGTGGFIAVETSNTVETN